MLDTAALERHYYDIANIHLRDIVPFYKHHHTLSYAGITCDFSRNHLTNTTLDLLIYLAVQAKIPAKITALFSGAAVNNTEHRAALHTALRSPQEVLVVDGYNIMPDIVQTQYSIKQLCDAIQHQHYVGFSGLAIDTIVHIGIGGSHLGMALACQALNSYKQTHLSIHFVSHLDDTSTTALLAKLNPHRTIFVIVSKTFSTYETLLNANYIRTWFLQFLPVAAVARHFIAASNNIVAMLEFGITQYWSIADFIGGRYSLWSAAGISIALYLGYANFSQLLAGARAMDEHFLHAELRHNLPVLLALIGIWNNNFFNYHTLAVLPYPQQLAALVPYLQQLNMESNGKTNTLASPLQHSSPIIWGSLANDAQHSYFQLLHQGSQIVPSDIIVINHDCNNHFQQALLANALAQANTLCYGSLHDNIAFYGNRPSNFFTLDKLSPFTLGAFLALHEHKVYIQGIIWGVNSFDQPGVQLGKQEALAIINKSQFK